MDVLPFPAGCTVANVGSIPLFFHAGSPFAALPISSKTGSVPASVLVDTGWAGCNAIAQSAAKSIGFQGAVFQGLCGGTGYGDVTIGPWNGYQVVEFDFSHVDKLLPPQLATIAAGTLVEQMFEIDLGPSPLTEGSAGRLTVFASRSEADVCSNPSSSLDACRVRWSTLALDEVDLKYFSSCPATRAKENFIPGTPDLRSVVPTLLANVNSIDVTLQLDTGRDASNRMVDISVNEAFRAALAKTVSLREVPLPKTNPGCLLRAFVPSDRGQSLRLRLGNRVVLLDQLLVKDGPQCQPPYSWTEPAGLIGMSVLAKARRLIIDPGSEKLLIEWR